MNLKEKIDEFPNFPKKGILFRDFSPILRDPSAISYVVEEFTKYFHTKDFEIFAGIESRGFLFACALALHYKKRDVHDSKKKVNCPEKQKKFPML